MEWWLLLVALGLLTGMVVGFFAGLLGIGGGGIMVPALTAYFLHQGVASEQVVHMALATSLSCIIINASLSTYTHHKHQAILWPLVWQFALFYALGSYLAGITALQLSSRTLALIFASMMSLVALQLIFNRQKITEPRPISGIKKASAGTLIGYLSALLAVGGGSMTVPFLHWHGIKLQQAIATAAALGLPIALAGCLAFAFSGENNSHLTPHSLGFVYWPATLALSLGASLSTGFGARLTHRLPVAALKKTFALLLLVLAIRMYTTLH